jgi:hypothetical protein
MLNLMVAYAAHAFITLAPVQTGFHKFVEIKCVPDMKWRAIILISTVIYAFVAYLFEVCQLDLLSVKLAYF